MEVGTKAIGWIFDGVRTAWNTFVTWTTRVRVRVAVEDDGTYISGHGSEFRVLALRVTASEKADLNPVKVELAVLGSPVKVIDITYSVTLPRVVQANRTEKLVETGTTLDRLLNEAGEVREALTVEVRIADHYERTYVSNKLELDRADLRKERIFDSGSV
jgi:hypothetical protein